MSIKVWGRYMKTFRRPATQCSTAANNSVLYTSKFVRAVALMSRVLTIHTHMHKHTPQTKQTIPPKQRDTGKLWDVLDMPPWWWWYVGVCTCLKSSNCMYEICAVLCINYTSIKLLNKKTKILGESPCLSKHRGTGSADLPGTQNTSRKHTSVWRH